MAIKSVREINYFKTLRDREITLSFCNLSLDKTKDELLYFSAYLVEKAKEEIDTLQCSQLTHMEKDCIITLLAKLQKDHLENIETITLTFIEAVHLYNILDYFENNYNSFKEQFKMKNIPYQLSAFAIIPSIYYNTIFKLKNNLEYKLGELVVKYYKFKCN